MSDPRETNGIHEERRDDLAAYALGALPTTDADEMRAHLNGCEACASHVEWLQRAVDLLPASTPHLTPPPSMKKNLMAEVKADVKRDRAAQRSSKGWRGFVLRPVIGTAAAVVLVAGAIVGYGLQPDDGTSPQTSTIAAKPTSSAAGNTMVASLVRTGDEARLHVEHLPQLPADSVYQTWLGENGSMVPSTPFVVRKDGTTEVAIDGNVSNADAVFVTTEPKGGSKFPTTQPILRAGLK